MEAHEEVKDRVQRKSNNERQQSLKPSQLMNVLI